MEDNRQKIFVNKSGNLIIFVTTVENKTKHISPTTTEDAPDEACFESTSQSGREEGEIPEASHTLTLPFHLLESVVEGLLEKLDILDTDLSETLVSSLIKALASLAGINVDVCTAGSFTEDTVLQIRNEALGLLAHKVNLKTMKRHENNLVVGYVTAVLSAAIINYTVMHPEALKSYSNESLTGSNAEFSVKKDLMERCAASPSTCKSISEMYLHSDRKETDERCSGDQKAGADTSPNSALIDVRPRVKRGIQGSLSKLFSFKSRAFQRVTPSSEEI